MKKLTLTLVAFLSIVSLGFAASKAQEGMFKRADTDGDGSLSKAEYVASRVASGKKKAEREGEKFDAKERTKAFHKQFARLDKNEDESLSAEEFFASFKKKD